MWALASTKVSSRQALVEATLCVADGLFLHIFIALGSVFAAPARDPHQRWAPVGF